MTVQTDPISGPRPNPFDAAGVRLPMVGGDPGKILDLAGLDFDVETRPIYTPDASGLPMVKDDDHVGIVRTDTDALLGIAKKGYHVVQYREAFAFLEETVAAGELIVETAVGWKNGARMLIQAKAPNGITVGDDVLDVYALVGSSHDGTSGLRFDLTNLRLSCTNMLPAIRRNSIGKFSHRHSTNVLAKAEAARQAMGLVHEFAEAQAAEIDRLQSTHVSDARFWSIVRSEFPTGDDLSRLQRDRALDRQAQVATLYFDSERDGAKYQGTGWGVLQAFSSWDLWGRPVRGDQSEAARGLRQIEGFLKGESPKRIQRIADRLVSA